MRESGTVISYNILIAIAKGIVTVSDRALLKENEGSIELGNKCCESITKRIGFVKLKAAIAKPIIASGLKSEIGQIFYHSIHKIVKANEILPDMIINIDQIFLPLILISKYTLEEKDTSRASVPGTADYRQITGTFRITMAGNFLLIQLIYQEKHC